MSDIVPFMLPSDVIAELPPEWVQKLVVVSNNLLLSFYEGFTKAHDSTDADVRAAEKLDMALTGKRETEQFYADFKESIELFKGLRASDINESLGADNIVKLHKAYVILESSEYNNAETLAVTKEDTERFIEELTVRSGQGYSESEALAMIRLAEIIRKYKKHFKMQAQRTPVYFLLNNPDAGLIKRMVNTLYDHMESKSDLENWRFL